MSAGQLAGQHIAQDIDHLRRLARHGQGGGIHLLERVVMIGLLQHDQRLAQRGGKAGVKGGVPLFILVTETDDDNV